MALLERCFCFSLAVAAAVIGVYSLVAYIIALLMEIWLIVQKNAELPAVLYVLCVMYLLIILITGLLLRGLSTRNITFILLWLTMISPLTLSEAGLVLFLSMHYWKVDSLYGLIEVSFWICRAVVNIAGIIILQSFYSNWKKQIQVLRSLRGLHMKSLERPRRISIVNSGEMKSDMGYQNAGFSVPTDNITSAKSIPKTNLRRSASSVSHLSVMTQMSGQHYRSSLPYRMNRIQLSSRPASPFIKRSVLEDEFPSPSEFSASNFNSALENALSSLNNVGLSRTQSMLNLSSHNFDFVPSKAMSVVDYPLQRYSSTQSLDRRSPSFSGGLPSNVDYLTNDNVRIRNAYFTNSLRRTDFRGRVGVILPPNIQYRYLDGNSANINSFYLAKRESISKSSLGNDSDDFQKYRDVAL